jgi:hypothetical protein
MGAKPISRLLVSRFISYLCQRKADVPLPRLSVRDTLSFLLLIHVRTDLIAG